MTGPLLLVVTWLLFRLDGRSLAAMGVDAPAQRLREWALAFCLMLAWAFARTGSIAAPIGLHLGWNLVAYLGFSGGPLGAGFVVPANGAAKMHAPGVWQVMLSQGVPLLLVAAVIVALARRQWHMPATLAAAIAPAIAPTG